MHQGLWDLNDASERTLFATTTDLIIAEPRFRIPGTFHFFVSADNPRNKMIHKIAAPAYQGRSSWPTFNVEFADRMLDYDDHSVSDKYRSCAQAILKDIRTATESSRRISGADLGAGAQVSHLGLQGCGGAFLVSQVPVGVEAGVWQPAAPLE